MGCIIYHVCSCLYEVGEFAILRWIWSEDYVHVFWGGGTSGRWGGLHIQKTSIYRLVYYYFNECGIITRYYIVIFMKKGDGTCRRQLCISSFISNLMDVGSLQDIVYLLLLTSFIPVQCTVIYIKINYLFFIIVDKYVK